MAERGWTVSVQITQTQVVFIFIYTRHWRVLSEKWHGLCFRRCFGSLEKTIGARSKQGAQGVRFRPSAA